MKEEEKEKAWPNLFPSPKDKEDDVGEEDKEEEGR